MLAAAAAAWAAMVRIPRGWDPAAAAATAGGWEEMLGAAVAVRVVLEVMAKMAGAVAHMALSGRTSAQRPAARAVLEVEVEVEVVLATVGLGALEALVPAAAAAVEQAGAVTLKRPNPLALSAGEAAGRPVAWV